jgi:hypothetical protein
MAEQESQSDDVLTKVAKTVGTALGTVASATSEIVGGKDDQPQATAARKKSKPRQSASANPAQSRARERMKAKRAKHRRKLHRKTKG